VKKTRISLLACISLLMAIAFSSCQPVTRSSSSTFQGTTISATNCDYGGELKSVEAVDQYTVKFSLCYPDASFPAKLASPAFSIFDSEFLNQTGGDSTVISESPVGTGPFVLGSVQPGENITLTANPNYWGTPAKTNEVIFSWTEDSFQRYVSVQTHVINAADNITSDVFDLVRNNNELELHYRPSINTYFIGFNNQVAPFDNLAVRQGFAQAIDRATMVSSLFPEGSTVADQFIPPEIEPGFSAGQTWYGYDLDEATASLDSANYNFGQVINLYYVETPANIYPDSATIAQNLSIELLHNMNIKIHPQVLTEEQFMEDLSQGQLGMFLLRLDAVYPDATNFFDPSFLENGYFFGQLDQQLIDEIRAGEQVRDLDARQAHYDMVNQLIHDTVPIIPIGHVNSAVINRVTLENVIIGPFNEDFPEMGNLTNQITFVQSTEPYSLNPLDELDRDTLRVASLLYNTLVNYQYGGTGIQTGLADSWSANADLTEWTFFLHYDVTFSNGAAFDANDVVATFATIWDAGNPNHTGRTGDFKIFQECFGNFLNAQ
jgi:peptide/nickel transport system substrate-binding protein